MCVVKSQEIKLYRFVIDSQLLCLLILFLVDCMCVIQLRSCVAVVDFCKSLLCQDDYFNQPTVLVRLRGRISLSKCNKSTSLKLHDNATTLFYILVFLFICIHLNRFARHQENVAISFFLRMFRKQKIQRAYSTLHTVDYPQTHIHIICNYSNHHLTHHSFRFSLSL